MEIITIDLVYLQRLCKRTEKNNNVGPYIHFHYRAILTRSSIDHAYYNFDGGPFEHLLWNYRKSSIFNTVSLYDRISPNYLPDPLSQVPCFCNLGRELRDHYTCNHASSFSQTYMGWSKDGLIHVYKNVMLAPS